MRNCLLILLFAGSVMHVTAEEMGTDERTRALYLSDLLIREGRLEEAEAWVRKNQATDSAAGEWNLRLAQILARRLRHRDAIKLYQKLLETRSDDPGLLFSLGNQAVEAHEYALAQEAFEKAREITGDPKAAYALAQLSFRRGNRIEGRRWANLALKDLEDPADVEEKLLQIKLRSILGWEETFEKEFEELHAEDPKNSSVLASWADLMMDFKKLDKVEKPLSLLKKIPLTEMTWRRLEASRLRSLGQYDELAIHLTESMKRFPGEPEFLYLRGESERRRRCWACAEVYLSSATNYFDKEREAKRQLISVRDEGHHWIGPSFLWRDSSSADLTGFGFGYRGLPRPHIKVTAEPGFASYKRKDGTKSGTVSGIGATVEIQRALWIAGISGDIRHDDGLSAVSPGIYGSWRPTDRWRFSGHMFGRRLTLNSVGELVAGIQTDQVKGSARFRLYKPLSLKIDARANRLTARAGGKAQQFSIVPGATLRVLNKMMYLALSYDFYHLNASSDADFDRAIGITTRARTHIGTLSASRYFIDDRFRPHAYIFSAEDAGRGRGFFSGNYVGWGVGFTFFTTDRWKFLADYSQTREDLDGIGERSQRVKARLEWRWGPNYDCHQNKRRPRHGR